MCVHANLHRDLPVITGELERMALALASVTLLEREQYFTV